MGHRLIRKASRAGCLIGGIWPTPVFDDSNHGRVAWLERLLLLISADVCCGRGHVFQVGLPSFIIFYTDLVQLLLILHLLHLVRLVAQESHLRLVFSFVYDGDLSRWIVGLSIFGGNHVWLEVGHGLKCIYQVDKLETAVHVLVVSANPRIHVFAVDVGQRGEFANKVSQVICVHFSMRILVNHPENGKHTVVKSADKLLLEKFDLFQTFNFTFNHKT